MVEEACTDYLAKPELVFVELRNRKLGDVEEIRTVSKTFKGDEDIAILCLKVPQEFSVEVISKCFSWNMLTKGRCQKCPERVVPPSCSRETLTPPKMPKVYMYPP